MFMPQAAWQDDGHSGGHQGLLIECTVSLGKTIQVAAPRGMTETQALRVSANHRGARWDMEPWFCSTALHNEATVRAHCATAPGSCAAGQDDNTVWIAKSWFWQGVLHRQYGPAKVLFETADAASSPTNWTVTLEWWWHGKRHRDHGPAILTMPFSAWQQCATAASTSSRTLASLNMASDGWHEEWFQHGRPSRPARRGPMKSDLTPGYVAYRYDERSPDSHAAPFAAFQCVSLTRRQHTASTSASTTTIVTSEHLPCQLPGVPGAPKPAFLSADVTAGTVNFLLHHPQAVDDDDDSHGPVVLHPARPFPAALWTPSREVYSRAGELQQQHFTIPYCSTTDADATTPTTVSLQTQYDAISGLAHCSKRFHKLFTIWHEQCLEATDTAPATPQTTCLLFTYHAISCRGTFTSSPDDEPVVAATLQGLAFWQWPKNVLQAVHVPRNTYARGPCPGQVRIPHGQWVEQDTSHTTFLLLLQEALRSRQRVPAAVLMHAIRNCYWTTPVDEDVPEGLQAATPSTHETSLHQAELSSLGLTWLPHVAKVLTWTPAVVMTALQCLRPPVFAATARFIPWHVWHTVAAFHDMPSILREKLCLWLAVALREPGKQQNWPLRTQACLTWFLAATPGHVPATQAILCHMAHPTKHWRFLLVAHMTAWRHVTWWLQHPSIVGHVPLRQALSLAGSYHAWPLLHALSQHRGWHDLTPRGAATILRRCLLQCDLAMVSFLVSWPVWRRFFSSAAAHTAVTAALRLLSQWTHGAMDVAEALLHAGFPPFAPKQKQRHELHDEVLDVLQLQCAPGTWCVLQDLLRPKAVVPSPRPPNVDDHVDQQHDGQNDDALPIVQPAKRQRIEPVIIALDAE